MNQKIKRFNQSNFTESAIDLPKKLSIYTSNGNFSYKLINSYSDGSCFKNTYVNVSKKNNDKLLTIDEPNNLYIDFNSHNTENGKKFIVSVTHGKSQKFEFTLEKPNILTVINYNGFGSKFDSESKFAFSDESLIALVKSLNDFGFDFTTKSFQFMDKYPYSYQYYESFQIKPLFKGIILVLNNGEPNRRSYLPNVLNFLITRGINYQVTSSVTELETIAKNQNVMGVISTGSDYRISSSRSKTEQELSHKALSDINKPLIGMCYGFQSMADFHGVKIKDSGKFFNDNIKLSSWSKDSEIFSGLDLDEFQFSVSFHDIVTKCPSGFKVIAKYKNNILGIENKKLMRWGLAFHPEDIERTYPILDNFIDICISNGEKDDDNDVDIVKYSDFD